MKHFICLSFSYIFMMSAVFAPHITASRALLTAAGRISLTAAGHISENSCGESCDDHILPDTATLPVVRQVSCRGNIIPAEQIFWQENAAGVRYSGTLTLLNYTYSKKDNTTTATYKGTLTYDLSQ